MPGPVRYALICQYCSMSLAVNFRLPKHQKTRQFVLLQDVETRSVNRPD